MKMETKITSLSFLVKIVAFSEAGHPSFINASITANWILISSSSSNRCNCTWKWESDVLFKNERNIMSNLLTTKYSEGITCEVFKEMFHEKENNYIQK